MQFFLKNRELIEFQKNLYPTGYNEIKFIQTTDSSIIQEKILSLLLTKLEHETIQHIFLASKLLENNTI